LVIRWLDRKAAPPRRRGAPYVCLRQCPGRPSHRAQCGPNTLQTARRQFGNACEIRQLPRR
jgi:hypothetical protein